MELKKKTVTHVGSFMMKYKVFQIESDGLFGLQIRNSQEVI